MKSRYNVFFTFISAFILGTGIASVTQAQVVPQTAPQATPVMQVEHNEQAVEQALKASVENDFKNLLSFPLDEEKMVAYVNAARRVQRINDKWDVQIASTESDKAAIEYNNYSIEEIILSLKKIPNLTLDQYNEMTRLISANKEFNRVYLAYKELVEKGRFQINDVQPETPTDMPPASSRVSAPAPDTAPATPENTVQTR